MKQPDLLDNSGSPVQPGLVLRAITLAGIALSLFQLYSAGVQPLGLFFQRPIHLGFVLVLCFLIFPSTGTRRPRNWPGWLIDGPLIIAAVIVGCWLPVNIDTIANAVFPRQVDVIIGVMTTVVVLEAARRAVAEGHLRKNLDTEQFAFEFDSLLLGYHKSARLLRDPVSAEHVKTSFETLLKNAKE